jgi:hypothetical protein
VTVTLTSPVLGKAVGDTYTGNLESWLLAEGYASQAGYTGPGVSNTGAAADVPANDPRLHSNREAPYFPLTPDEDATIANDADHLGETSRPLARFDMDAAGADTEAPSSVTLKPKSGKAAGGTKVTITGDNLEGVTAVNFGATPGVNLDTSTADDGVITVETPAGTAGPVDVTLVDASGNDVETAGFTYNA